LRLAVIAVQALEHFFISFCLNFNRLSFVCLPIPADSRICAFNHHSDCVFTFYLGAILEFWEKTVAIPLLFRLEKEILQRQSQKMISVNASTGPKRSSVFFFNPSIYFFLNSGAIFLLVS